MEIVNRHILITGASRGIGRAVARMCAEDKAHLHLIVRKQEPGLTEELQALGAKSVTLWEADLSERKDVEKLLSDLRDVPVDILFNNAGTFTGGTLEEQEIDDVYKMFQVNVNALVHLTRGLLPGMLDRKRGKIINNSSVSAFMHIPGSSTYAATKAAVVAFTNCIRLELKGTGVTTLLLVTPPVKTQLFEDIESHYSKKFGQPIDTMSATRYAQIIREGILQDLEAINPSGIAGIGLKLAKFARPLFEMEVMRRFKR